MDKLVVTVYRFENDSETCHPLHTLTYNVDPRMDDDTARLVALGLVYERNYLSFDISLCVVREDAHTSRVLLDDKCN
jgi:hypothetical protein